MFPLTRSPALLLPRILSLRIDTLCRLSLVSAPLLRICRLHYPLLFGMGSRVVAMPCPLIVTASMLRHIARRDGHLGTAVTARAGIVFDLAALAKVYDDSEAEQFREVGRQGGQVVALRSFARSTLSGLGHVDHAQARTVTVGLTGPRSGRGSFDGTTARAARALAQGCTEALMGGFAALGGGGGGEGGGGGGQGAGGEAAAGLARSIANGEGSESLPPVSLRLSTSSAVPFLREWFAWPSTLQVLCAVTSLTVEVNVDVDDDVYSDDVDDGPALSRCLLLLALLCRRSLGCLTIRVADVAPAEIQRAGAGAAQENTIPRAIREALRAWVFCPSVSVGADQASEWRSGDSRGGRDSFSTPQHHTRERIARMYRGLNLFPRGSPQDATDVMTDLFLRFAAVAGETGAASRGPAATVAAAPAAAASAATDEDARDFADAARPLSSFDAFLAAVDGEAAPASSAHDDFHGARGPLEQAASSMRCRRNGLESVEVCVPGLWADADLLWLVQVQAQAHGHRQLARLRIDGLRTPTQAVSPAATTQSAAAGAGSVPAGLTLFSLLKAFPSLVSLQLPAASRLRFEPVMLHTLHVASADCTLDSITRTRCLIHRFLAIADPLPGLALAGEGAFQVVRALRSRIAQLSSSSPSSHAHASTEEGAWPVLTRDMRVALALLLHEPAGDDVPRPPGHGEPALRSVSLRDASLALARPPELGSEDMGGLAASRAAPAWRGLCRTFRRTRYLE